MSYLFHYFYNTPFRKINISSIDDFRIALNQAKSGDYLELADGVYHLGRYRMNRHGTSRRPIVIGAKNLLGAKLAGTSTFEISGQYVYITGIDFQRSQLVLSHRNHVGRCRVSQCRFTGGSHLHGSLLIYHSAQNRIDRCEIRDPIYRGMMLESSRMSDVASVKYGGMGYNWIERCWFRDHKNRGTVGGETLSLGHSSEALQPFYTLVENCTFTECYGSTNVVSIKSADNTILNCVFRNSIVINGRPANLTIRSGRNNQILNCDLEGYNAIIVSGDNHIIQENNLSYWGDARGPLFANIEVRTGNVYTSPGQWRMGRKETGSHPTSRNCYIINNRIQGSVRLGVLPIWGIDQNPNTILSLEEITVFGSGPVQVVGPIKGYPKAFYDYTASGREPEDLTDFEPDELLFPSPDDNLDYPGDLEE